MGFNRGFNRYYEIKLRVMANDDSLLVRVLPNSQLSLRKEVERLAHYFRQEFDYDFVQFSTHDKDRRYTAYLFGNHEVWYGACCFRKRRVPGYEFEALQWIWMHPFMRNKGHLSREWKTLRENHGDFYVESPISDSMIQFLKSHNRDSVFAYGKKLVIKDKALKKKLVGY